jgi:hypothetical protein
MHHDRIAALSNLALPWDREKSRGSDSGTKAEFLRPATEGGLG